MMKTPLKTLLFLAVATLTTSTFAEGNRQTVEFDHNTPIVILDKLQSLKNQQNLQVSLPKIEHFTTNNGTPVAFVYAEQIPIIDIAVYFNAGSARDDSVKKGGYGLASLTASLLTQGTSELNENELADALEQLGISLDTDVYKDMFTVNLRSLSDPKYLNPAIDLLAQVLSKPTFAEENLERTKARFLIGIKKSQEDPDSVASDTFNKHLYGSHPYANPTNGTLESIPQIQAMDLQRFHQQFLVAKNANIAITGKVSLEQAKQIANHITQNLPTGSPAPALPDAKPLSKSKTVHIPFDSQQTSIIIGQLSTKRLTDPASLQQNTYFAVADDVVGGGTFYARLMADIRKKRGLTYGIYSHLSRMQSQGSYSIRFSTRNDKADEAIDATLAVVKNTLKNGITQAELDLTKENLINSFPLSLASNASINGNLASMGFYGLPDNYLSNYIERIQQTDLEKANQSYRQMVNPDKFLIVTVGGDRQTTDK